MQEVAEDVAGSVKQLSVMRTGGSGEEVEKSLRSGTGTVALPGPFALTQDRLTERHGMIMLSLMLSWESPPLTTTGSLLTFL